MGVLLLFTKIGVIRAATLIAEIGDITDYPSGEKLAG